MASSQVMSGAKAVFSIVTATSTVDIAYASNCSYNWNHNVQAIEVMGLQSVKEHTELGMTVDLSCSVFRLYGEGAVKLGLQPKLNALLTQPDLIAKICNRAGDTLFFVEGVKLISRSGSIDARGIWTETLNFVGRMANDEAGK